jgi:hypothetical protein
LLDKIIFSCRQQVRQLSLQRLVQRPWRPERPQRRLLARLLLPSRRQAA